MKITREGAYIASTLHTKKYFKRQNILSKSYYIGRTY